VGAGSRAPAGGPTRRPSPPSGAPGGRAEGPGRPLAAGPPPGGRARPLLAPLSRPAVWALGAAPWRRRHARGEGISGRYGAAGRGGGPPQAAAEPLRSALRERCPRGALALPPEQTRLRAGGRWASARRQRRGQGPPEPGDVLGWPPMGSPTPRGQGTGRRGPSAQRRRQKRPEVQPTRRERRPGPSAQRGAWRTRVVGGPSRSSGVPRTRGRRRVGRAGRRRSWGRIVRRRSQRHRLPWQRREPLATQGLPAPSIMPPYPAPRWRVTPQGKSPVRSCRPPGFGRGGLGNWHPYRDRTNTNHKSGDTQ
jgi:RNA-directed DNA polymerase